MKRLKDCESRGKVCRMKRGKDSWTKPRFCSLIFSLFWFAGGVSAAPEERPAGIPAAFVEVRAAVPDILVELRYFGRDNFTGNPVDGYTASRCWMTQSAAKQLAKAQAELRPFGLSLKVFDAYRPQAAVDRFLRWAKEPDDKQLKRLYYPSVSKPQLIKEGYIAGKSGHSRGSTVDVTIAAVSSAEHRETGKELDMGTPFDFFGPESHTENPRLTPQQRANRLLLKSLMERHGFVNYPKEWWHFTLKDEPFPDTYFNFSTGGLSPARPAKRQ